MAEHDADRDRDESRDPLDEDAAWAELVAAYGEQPDPATGRWPASGDVLDAAARPAPEGGRPPAADPTGPEEPPLKSGPAASDEPARPERPGSFIVYAPGVGPRDWDAPSEEALDDSEEGHFVPPEPPPLPTGDVTSRFAWIAVLGGPLLLLIMVLLRQELTWWVTTLGVGGFLGGFATLVLRMKDTDEEDDDPGRGAVV
ncbi:hypothetical protein [Streptomyces albireticuli]|uniref:DUF308 domain-containing protein n=1 Tax=Streptomyces albireticuli TaxID=1940 RepID=A0A2A2D1X4_9ACTN|nr:hypothetical protein [Streptomyces albireticuli]MCD9142114.1 hypothetical protein [Streptomyces albireticuli]MCD9162632.1 hypothetical protein [Streptomyces albireticuli]MCD9190288.1 hypothetical protein [Streptomyces albireticuli]PAU45340.1 hypothetical protein CK936_30110 [Streptomyces albireticuli]